MVDAHDSKSCLERGEGSSPFSGTWKSKKVFIDILKETSMK